MSNKKVCNKLISELSSLNSKYPTAEKILIVPDYQIGHQILENLARSGTHWINFRLATTSSLASEIAEEAIIKEKLEFLSGTENLAIVDDIFGRLWESAKLKYFKKHSVNKGIVEALAKTIRELRISGFTSDGIKKEHFVDKAKSDDIRSILSEYENVLSKKKLIDGAGFLKEALKSLKAEKKERKEKFIVLSRHYMKGLEREFVEKLTGDNLIVIEEDHALGLEAPTGAWPGSSKEDVTACSTDVERLKWIFDGRKAPKPFKDGTVDIFSAAGYRNEVREVFRRILAGDVPIDDVEIVYTDTENYGDIIHSLCEKLDIPVTFSDGIAGYLSGPYSAVMRFLIWIREDFSEIYLRRMLESGDLKYKKPDDKDTPGSSVLAYLLRTSGVGWGRNRYDLIIGKKMEEWKKNAVQARKEGDPEEAEFREKKAGQIKELRKLCLELLNLVPEPDKEGKLDFSGLCRGCVEFVRNHTKVRSANDSAFLDTAAERLGMLANFAESRVTLDDAVEKLINTISGIRGGASGPRPGSLHASHYKDGGRSGRGNTFVIGVDESRFPGRGVQDPILLDEERKRLGSGLELSDERIKKNLYDMAGLLSGLRGKVTVSYSAYDIKEGRKVFPSFIVLQLFRVKEGRYEADYKELFDALGEPIGFNFSTGPDILLDETDWWVNRLASTEIPKNGIEAVPCSGTERKHGAYGI